jgi:hypothetical protein
MTLVTSLLNPKMGQGSTRSNGNWATSKVQEVLQTWEVVEFMRSSCLSRDACNSFTAFIIPLR